MCTVAAIDKFKHNHTPSEWDFNAVRNIANGKVHP